MRVCYPAGVIGLRYFTYYGSPIGRMVLLSDGMSLTGLGFQEKIPESAIINDDLPVFLQTKSWLDAYFRGENPPMDIPLRPGGTAFQHRVWEILNDIPYGKVCTYGDIAHRMNCRSSQAIGQAVGRNPIAIVIPCHRVVGVKGQLTGYAWGLEKKQWLLLHEKILCETM